MFSSGMEYSLNGDILRFLMLTIDSETYDELLADAQFLAALRAAGVDNWGGYDDAIDILNEWQLEDSAD